MFIGVLLMYRECVLHHVCSVPVDAGRECQVPWDWLQLPVTDGLLVTTCVLEIEPGSY